MQRVTATIEDEVMAAIRRVAGSRGVSRFLNLAARERLARLEILKMLDEMDEQHGKPSKAVRDEVARKAKRIFRR